MKQKVSTAVTHLNDQNAYTGNFFNSHFQVRVIDRTAGGWSLQSWRGGFGVWSC